MKKFSCILRLILLNILVSTIILPYKVIALEPKEVENIDLDSLIEETQSFNSQDGLTAIWWIPQEFWAASLSQSDSMSASEIEEFLKTLEPYFMLGVVQGEMSPLGAAKFYNLEQVQKNLTFYFEDSTGNKKTLTPTDKISPDVELLQNMIRPMLAQMMGNLGQNFHFFTFEAQNIEGTRTISPYEKGTIKVNLLGNSSIPDSDVIIDLPLNSLFVPRICPNGQEAHISWKFCPWDGTKLKE